MKRESEGKHMDYYNYKMVNRYEQVELFSESEYQRRIRGVREIMKQRNVDVALFLECAEETYDHWLTGRRFLDYVIVPSQGECTAVLYREFDESGCAPAETVDFSRYSLQREPAARPCGEMRFINRLPDEKIADIVAAGKPSRIGLILPDHMNAALFDGLTAKLPKAEFADITLDVALFKAVKSEEEIFAIQQSAYVQRKIFEALPQMIRPGGTVAEVNKEINYYLSELGSSGCCHGGMQNKGNMDTPAVGMGGKDPNAPIQYGDRMFCMFEANGPGHQHYAFGRHFVMGEPSPGFAKAVEIAIKTHQYAVALMKPDSLTLAQIAVKTRKYCNKLGYTLMERVGWNWMHSMGAYYYEQYSLEDYSEDTPLRSNILLHCHPVTYRSYPEIDPNIREDQMILNTYLITDDGARDLVGVPLDLVVLH